MNPAISGLLPATISYSTFSLPSKSVDNAKLGVPLGARNVYFSFEVALGVTSSSPHDANTPKLNNNTNKKEISKEE